MLLIVFLIGLFYILLPGPSSIDDFPPLPNSVKSKLEGDTIQNPNIAAYFSDYQREDITRYYRDHFEKKLLFGLPFPIVSINRRPEESYQYVRDQQESTFLEEYVNPLRESIYINGYEPKVENDMFNKKDRSFEGDRIAYEGRLFNSKATLRFYPSSIWWRIFIYLGIWLAGLSLYRLTIKVLK